MPKRNNSPTRINPVDLDPTDTGPPQNALRIKKMSDISSLELLKNCNRTEKQYQGDYHVHFGHMNIPIF